MLTYFLLWFPMLLIAILNGTLRDLWYARFVGELTAHQLSTITLIAFFAMYIRFVICRFMPASSLQAIYIGLFWLFLTLLFEFGFGFFRKQPLDQMLGAYNIMKGRLWILIPLWVAIAPYVFYKRCV